MSISTLLQLSIPDNDGDDDDDDSTEQHPAVQPINEYAVTDVVPAVEDKKKNKKVF